MPSDSRKKIRSGLARRRRKDVAFRLFGVAATATGLLFLAFFFLTLLAAGADALLPENDRPRVGAMPGSRCISDSHGSVGSEHSCR